MKMAGGYAVNLLAGTEKIDSKNSCSELVAVDVELI